MHLATVPPRFRSVQKVVEARHCLAIPDDREIDGINAIPALTGRGAPARPILWALDSVSDLEFAMRLGNWKLLLDRERRPRELYNLVHDRLELMNVIEQNENVVRGLSQLFEGQMRSIEADPLRPN